MQLVLLKELKNTTDSKRMIHGKNEEQLATTYIS